MASTTRIHVENCYGCNPGNPIGLKAVFTNDGNSLKGNFQSLKDHQGPPGFVHGGIISAFSDEGCSYFARMLSKCDVLTIRNEIRFKNPAKLGDVISIEVHLKNEKSRTLTVTSTLYADGKVIAIGESSLMKVKQTDID